MPFLDPLNGSIHILNGRGAARYTISTDDYYAYCTAGVFSHRLYQDFEADACLIIHEPRRFVADLAKAAGSVLPGYTFGTSGVRYVDPLVAPPTAVPVQVIKHFRFAYQREFRCVLQAPAGSSRTLHAVFVTIPQLFEYVELVAL